MRHAADMSCAWLDYKVTWCPVCIPGAEPCQRAKLYLSSSCLAMLKGADYKCTRKYCKTPRQCMPLPERYIRELPYVQTQELQRSSALHGSA